MRVLLIDNGSSYLRRIQDLLKKDSVTTLSFSKPLSSQQTNFDLVILSGGHLPIVGYESEYKLEIEFLQQLMLPTIGICLGCELIAYAYGSKLQEMPEKQHGLVQINTVRSDPIFADLPAEGITVFESHRWAISQLGNQIIGLAKSENGYEIIRHIDKPMLGLQFHPEMMAEQNLGDEIFRNIIQNITN